MDILLSLSCINKCCGILGTGLSAGRRIIVPGTSGAQVTYIATERPAIYYCNPNYIQSENMTSYRRSRADKFYYVDLHFISSVDLDKRVGLVFYFYEFLSNQYKRSFVEMHFNWCDLLEKDLFFGSALRQGRCTKPCPHLAGDFNFYNMTISLTQIPSNFPFKKGRIYCNVTYDLTDRMAEASVDFEIRSKRVKVNRKSLN